MGLRSRAGHRFIATRLLLRLWLLSGKNREMYLIKSKLHNDISYLHLTCQEFFLIVHLFLSVNILVSY